MSSNIKSGFKKIISAPEMTVTISLLGLSIITMILSPVFLTMDNLVSILRNLAFVAIVAVGESLCILIGKLDLSVAQMAGLGAVLSTYFMTTGGMSPGLAIIACMAFAVGFGLLNGLLVAKVGLAPFIATIGTTYLARGIKYIITGGYPVYPLPDSVSRFGLQEPLGLSWAFWIAIILIVAFDIILRHTRFGRNIYAVGDNAEVAKMSGINDQGIVLIVYIICAVTAALSGTLMAFQLQTGQPTIGEGWDMQAISAIAVGGISLAGGRGTMLGTLLGVVFISILNNALVLFKMDSNIVTILTGVVLILAVCVDVIRNRRKIKA